MADDVRMPLVRYAGKLLSRMGALTGDRDCCCCEPGFCVRYYEYPFDGLPDGPSPFPPFSSYYTGPGLNRCVFELAHGVENCVSTSGERLYKIWIASCCPLDNYGGDINTFFADEIDQRMYDFWIAQSGAISERYSLIYCFDCGGLNHDGWPPSPNVIGGGVDLPNPYPPYGEPCNDGYYELNNWLALDCESLKRSRYCCEGLSTGF